MTASPLSQQLRARWAIERNALLAQLHAAETQLTLVKMRFSVQRTAILNLFSDASFDVQSIASMEEEKSAATTRGTHASETLCTEELVVSERLHTEEMAALRLKLTTTIRLVHKQHAQNRQLEAFIQRLKGAHESVTPILQPGAQPTLELQRVQERVIAERLLRQ